MIVLGWAAKLDHSKIPNRVNLLDSLQHPSFDANRDYTMPWQSGMTGLAYNKKLVAELGLQPPKSFKDLLRSQYKGKITFLTEMRDTRGPVHARRGQEPAKATIDDGVSGARHDRGSGERAGRCGGSPATTTPTTSRTATSSPRMAWSGDVVQLQQEQPGRSSSSCPDEGGMLFSDNMIVVVTERARRRRRGLDRLRLRPAARRADHRLTVQYISPVKGVSDVLKKHRRPSSPSNPLINPPDDVQKRLHIFKKLTADEEKKFNDPFNADPERRGKVRRGR